MCGDEDGISEEPLVSGDKEIASRAFPPTSSLLYTPLGVPPSYYWRLTALLPPFTLHTHLLLHIAPLSVSQRSLTHTYFLYGTPPWMRRTTRRTLKWTAMKIRHHLHPLRPPLLCNPRVLKNTHRQRPRI